MNQTIGRDGRVGHRLRVLGNGGRRLPERSGMAFGPRRAVVSEHDALRRAAGGLRDAQGGDTAQLDRGARVGEMKRPD